MSFLTVSAILRGAWLLEPNAAKSLLPVAMQILEGKPSAFQTEKPKDIEPVLLSVQSRSAYGVSPRTDLSHLPDSSVAVVTIAGPLLKVGGMCSYGMTDYASLISRLASSSNVSGIIINLDSPGGQANGTAMLSDTIIRAKQKKPVLGLIDDGMAASAGLWVASAVQELYVSQATDQVGGVGVYTTIADWKTHYAEYYKLQVKEVYSRLSGDKNSEYREALNGNEEPLKDDLDSIAKQFISTVRRNRAGKIQGDDWTTGKMFNAKEALKIGLIDGIKSFDQVVQRINQLIN